MDIFGTVGVFVVVFCAVIGAAVCIACMVRGVQAYKKAFARGEETRELERMQR